MKSAKFIRYSDANVKKVLNGSLDPFYCLLNLQRYLNHAHTKNENLFSMSFESEQEHSIE